MYTEEEKRLRRNESKKRSRLKQSTIEREKLYAIEYRKKNKDKLHDLYMKNKRKIISYVNHTNKTRDSGLLSKYLSMQRRCKYKSQRNYKWYGARGITVEWLSYADFKRDMYDSYIEHLSIYGHKQTTIDRIDPDKNYCKENCRWATLSEQCQNKRNLSSTLLH